MSEEDADWRPSIVAICYECKQELTTCKNQHGEGTTSVRMMNTVKYIRMNDDLLEHTAAFSDPEGNVTISLAQFQTLMTEAGWKLR